MILVSLSRYLKEGSLVHIGHVLGLYIARTLVEDEVHVIVLASNLIAPVVELDAIDNLSVGDSLTGPVTIELLVIAVPSVIVDHSPVVGGNGRILKVNRDLVRLKYRVVDRVMTGNHTTHSAANQQADFQGGGLIDIHTGTISDLSAVAGGGLATIEGIDELCAIGLAHG